MIRISLVKLYHILFRYIDVYDCICINGTGQNHTLIPFGLQAVACHGPIAVHAEFLAPWSWQEPTTELAILGYPMTGSYYIYCAP